jgi:hypothetical protein
VNTETLNQQQADVAGGVPLAMTGGMYNVWTGMGVAVAGVGYVAAPSVYERTDTTTDIYLFEVKGETLVWSARTRTTNSDEGNLTPVVAQIVNVVVETMRRDRVI